MTRGGKLAYLTLLYFAQGLPFGFQATALPAILYSHGVSLATLGFTGLLALPWALKLLWAPFVDRTASRKIWIITMQSLLTAACVAATWRPDVDEPAALRDAGHDACHRERQRLLEPRAGVGR